MVDSFMSAGRELFQDSFQNSHIEFNKRKVNGVVHELTRVVLSDPSFNIYDYVPLTSFN